MKKILYILLISNLIFCLSFGQVNKSVSQLSNPPRLPSNIPPPPSFASISSKSGKYQIVSAEYYSQDTKPFLYTRLIKYDTTTGKAWILYSKRNSSGEQRVWVPLTDESEK